MKKIVPEIEIFPNYIWHIFAIANLWDSKNLEYYIKYKEMIYDEDSIFLFNNRNLLAWGNGRGGEFSGLLFFIPLSYSYITYNEYIKYLNLLIKSIASKDWKEFKDNYNFKYDMTDVDFTKANIDFLKQYLSIIEKYYFGYLNELWKYHKNLLNQTSNYLLDYFKKLNAIEKWESCLNKKFPADEFLIILTVANKNLPTANNLSRNRYNFYHQPNSKEKLSNLILHEIGTNLLFEDLHNNYKDEELQTEFIKKNNLIWQSFESIAEFIKSKIFKIDVEIWDGEMFGGGNYYFKYFYDYYKSFSWKNIDVNYQELMKKAVLHVNEKLSYNEK